ncbi:T9SS type A sorting domain-containing protein [bacterium]|nr:T9SS type A sorting domain-containing protein [bacterium]
MKRLLQSAAGLFLVALFLCIMSSEALAQGYGRTRKLVIAPRSARVQAGETLQFTATIMERNQAQKDTVITWSVDATGFGEIGEDGLFTALDRGRGYVYAAAGDLSASAHVAVIDTNRGDAARSLWSHLEIIPADTLLILGETVQYAASLIDSAGVAHDTTVTWILRGGTVGTLSDDGFFTAEDRGVGLVMASLDRFTATTRVLVATVADTASRDTVRIRLRDKDGIMLGDSCRVQDSSVYVINGLPYPYNVLNGGELLFQPGSLGDNIQLDITLSDAATVEGDGTVSFADQILNGIRFDVYVDGVLVSPYYFDQPVQLILPFKETLIDSLGLSEEDLWIFFYDSEGDYDGDGITNVVIDTSFNKIYADVIHFSDLVIAASDRGSTHVTENGKTVPVSHTLLGNYPNPFNPATTIGFVVGGDAVQPVTLTVYNLLGQKVRTLVNGNRTPGSYSVTWDGRDDAGRLLSSGVFIYRFTAGEEVMSRRMLLLN